MVMILDEAHALEPTSASRIVSTLMTSGADYATARIMNRSPLGEVLETELRRSHAQDAPLVDVAEPSGYLHDTGLINKVFNKEFLLRVLATLSLEEPGWQTGLALSALLEAEFISVSADVIVIREHPTESAAVRRARLALDEVERRHASFLSGLATVAARGTSELTRAWRIHALKTLYGQLYPLTPRATDEYWSALQLCSSEAAEGITLENLHPLTPHERLLTHFTLKGDRESVETLTYFRSDHGSAFGMKQQDGHVFAVPDYLPQLHVPIPETLLLLDPDAVPTSSKITEFSWDSDGNLLIGGWAYLAGVNLEEEEVSTTIRVTNVENQQSATITTVPTTSILADLDSTDRFRSYTRSGFQACLPRELLSRLSISTEGQRSHLLITAELTWGTLTVIAPLGARNLTGTTGHLPLDHLRGGFRYVPTFDGSNGFTLQTTTPRYALERLSIVGRTIDLVVSTTTGLVADHLLFSHNEAKLIVRGRLLDVDGNRGTYQVTLPALPATVKAPTESEWLVHAVSGLHGSQLIALAADESSLGVAALGRLWAEASGFGFLRLKERPWRILVESVHVADDAKHLVVAGFCDFPAYQSLNIALTTGRQQVRGDSAVTIDSDAPVARFTASIPLHAKRWDAPQAPLETGAYSLRFFPSATWRGKGHWMSFTRIHRKELPTWLPFDGGVLEITQTARNGAVKISLQPDMAPAGQTHYAQHALQERHFKDMNARPLLNAVLAQCYAGRKITDAPLEIARRIRENHPHVPIYWATMDSSIPIPMDAERVIVGTEKWYELLSSARVLINNNNFPAYFRKRPGQYYLQTWHGTPLKRLVLDVDSANFSLSYWALMAREATYWDALLAQDDYGAEVLAKAFGFTGPVITEGYPRNDSLFNDDAPNRRAEVRARLGIPPGHRVALYAPTWRDNAKATASQYAMVTYLDFDKFNEALGNEWTILLRGHHNVAASRETSSLNVLDVTDYPDINDLYLAADILINDYSSVMFDFAVTRKPIIFLTPDIDDYSGEVRGFYFDLKSTAPGPICLSTDEVIRAIQRLELTQVRHRGRYLAFVSTYAGRDDGAATERVMGRLALDAAFDGTSNPSRGDAV